MSSYRYNPSNEPTSTSNGSYTYDANGNTLTDASGRNYTWDFNNRLTQVTLPSAGGTVTYKYDPFGRRIQKSFVHGSSTTMTNYLYDGSNVIEEVDASGNQIARYSQSPAVDRPLTMTRAGVTSFYQQDALGSITTLANAAGVITDTYTYDSFGNATVSSGTTSNPFRYTGREFDSETGLYYYRARYYDPTVGRLLNEDRLRFAASVNFYAYVGSSPPNFTDPSGLLPAHDNDKLQPKPWDFREIIIELLKDNNRCSCWFKTGKRSPQEIIDIISRVPIIFRTGPDNIGGDTNEEPSAPIEINPKGMFYPSSPYSVGHNPDGTPIYAPGTFEAQMVILLHELAHKVMPEGFKSDGRLADPPDASEKNTRLLI